MAHRIAVRWGWSVLGVALLATPVVALAQVSPTAPVHPTLPWAGITTPHGQLIRFIYVPPQPILLEYLVIAPPESGAPPVEPAPPPAEGEVKPEAAAPEAPAPGSAPATPQVVRQQVTVPGYYVRETTVGFHYPDRWAIEQAAPNVYRWRQVPAQFVPK
jgi:hypothetical protein